MVILKAKNISKQYRLGLVGTGTISHDLNRWWAGIRGKEDPYLKVGAVNDRSTKADSDYVWALRDINFEVNKGEVLGIIGKNGAGKSTLLKILSRVTIPTTGEIKTKGRIASLLEVGTGFHPELTGRENIYLNGAILGMTKAEIKAKEQEIIDFSGCERYVDTPVKRYSSGMTVRLAFAVAAHLEPDILVIDEVLAVGDAEFQKKAIGKMQDISKGDGRTVLFVSHNMAAVKSLCSRAIVLEHGKTVFEGETDDAVDFYLENANTILKSRTNIFPLENTNYGIIFKNIFIKEIEQSSICVKLLVDTKLEIKNIGFGIKIKDFNDIVIGSITPAITGESFNLKKGESEISFYLKNFLTLFSGGNYYFDVWVAKPKLEMIIYGENVIGYVIPKKDRFSTGVFHERNKHGIINMEGTITM
ncbi:ABC transporter ATP-binding protein [Xanthomarina spongicola]|uniref:Lipopolysaccharide transport system ATP-binding protein n=1 Tax=Xanthomarina spongicola TaxID=570520 RepID=A0A316E6S0_9FLAO|nr:polysaccharide ABC transporter ATP-binding protein [Xanthomarina spongicola]PWK18640.1 lipopolysaccharide transport system ATP-binding protein [Xanthomarina spongicola]